MRAIVWLGLALCASAFDLAAQEFQPIVRDGWEAFRRVDYVGGTSGVKAKKMGALVLTDSTLEFHECRVGGCYDSGEDKPLFKEAALFVIVLRGVVEVTTNSQVRANSPFALSFSKDKTEEFVAITYESASSAEAPVFKTQKAQSAALVAKINFRRKKLGANPDSLSTNYELPGRRQ